MISFEEAYGWLNRFFDAESYMSESIMRLFGNMDNAFGVGDYPKVIYYIGVIEDVGKRVYSGGDINLGEIYLRCGRAYYRLNDYRSAIQEFREAISYYQQGDIPTKLNRGVAGWLLGWAFWNISKQSDAIAEWEMCAQTFEDMMRRPEFNNFSTHRAWCEDQHRRMSDAICRSIDNVHVGRWPHDR